MRPCQGRPGQASIVEDDDVVDVGQAYIYMYIYVRFYRHACGHSSKLKSTSDRHDQTNRPMGTLQTIKPFQFGRISFFRLGSSCCCLAKLPLHFPKSVPNSLAFFDLNTLILCGLRTNRTAGTALHVWPHNIWMVSEPTNNDTTLGCVVVGVVVAAPLPFSSHTFSTQFEYEHNVHYGENYHICIITLKRGRSMAGTNRLRGFCQAHGAGKMCVIIVKHLCYNIFMHFDL